jgi:hypothetical protein
VAKREICPMAPLGLPLGHRWETVWFDKFGTGKKEASFEKCKRCTATRGMAQHQGSPDGLITVTFPRFCRAPGCARPRGHKGGCSP